MPSSGVVEKEIHRVSYGRIRDATNYLECTGWVHMSSHLMRFRNMMVPRIVRTAAHGRSQNTLKEQTGRVEGRRCTWGINLAEGEDD